MHKKNESGMLMLTVIAILGVLGLIAAGMLFGRHYLQVKQRLGIVQNDVADIALTVRALSLHQKDFSMLSDVTNVEAGRQFLGSLRSTTTPFGGNSYYSVVYDPNFPDVFSVYVVNIDNSYCKKLNDSIFRGAVGGGCGETYANSRFIQSQQKMGVAVAVNPNTGIVRLDGRFGVFFKKI